MRLLASFGVVAALWCAFGASIFPDWYYVLFWGGGFHDADFWGTGIDYWLGHPALPIGVGLLGLVIVLLAYRYRLKVLAVADQVSSWVIGGSIVAILVTAAIVFEYGRLTYGPLQQILALNAALIRLQGTTSQPVVVQPPIDFRFIDKSRVQALYNQIEPELVESQRKVETGSDVSGKVGLKAGPAEAEVGGSKQQGETSTFERPAFSPERQCVELMNFLLKGNQIRYYTDGTQWINQKAATSFRVQLAELQKNFAVIGKNKVAAPQPENLVGVPPTKEEEEAAQQQLNQFEKEFSTELTSLQGMVIVEGEFSASRAPDESPVLLEKFSDRPRQVVFKVIAPSAPELSQIAALGKTHLRVFGSVLKPLDDSGTIEIRPIAVY